MGRAADSQTIRLRFEAQWPGSGSPTIDFSFYGTTYDPVPGRPYVRFAVVDGSEHQTSMGKVQRWERAGLATLNIFVPVGSGDGLAKELADRFAAIFRGRTVSNIVFRGCSFVPVGVDGAHDQYTATIPFSASEYVANPNPN